MRILMTFEPINIEDTREAEDTVQGATRKTSCGEAGPYAFVVIYDVIELLISSKQRTSGYLLGR
jgi:hypothetical protein